MRRPWTSSRARREPSAAARPWLSRPPRSPKLPANRRRLQPRGSVGGEQVDRPGRPDPAEAAPAPRRGGSRPRGSAPAAAGEMSTVPRWASARGRPSTRTCTCAPERTADRGHGLGADAAVAAHLQPGHPGQQLGEVAARRAPRSEIHHRDHARSGRQRAVGHRATADHQGVAGVTAARATSRLAAGPAAAAPTLRSTARHAARTRRCGTGGHRADGEDERRPGFPGCRTRGQQGPAVSETVTVTPRPRRWWQGSGPVSWLAGRSTRCAFPRLPPPRTGAGLQWLTAGFVAAYSGGAAPDLHRTSAGRQAVVHCCCRSTDRSRDGPGTGRAS